MWRPKEGWENPYADKYDNQPHRAVVYEAGADAMLKALRDNAKRFKEWEPVGKEGYLIFVPLE